MSPRARSRCSMTRRCGPSPTIVARSATAGSSTARACSSTRSIASGRFRDTNRIAETTCTEPSWCVDAVAAPPGCHHAASTPLGTTSTRAPRAAADTRWAAIVDTALSATPRRAQRSRCPIARNTTADRSMTQWNVAATGSPTSSATGTRSVAKGLTTPRWACATSKPPASSRRRISGGANGLTGMPPGTPHACRCTVTPSSPRSVAPPRSPPGPGVAVKTSTSCPAATRWRERSRTWLSIPPRRGG